MQINNFKIKRQDKYNIVIEEYRELVNPKTKESRYEWVDLGKYFGTLKKALDFLGEYILSKGLDLTNDFTSFKNYVESYTIKIVEDEENDYEIKDL